MVQELDPRIVKLSVEVNGRIKTYQGLAITARGTKYANALQNEAEITISNLDRATQDYILTETSPYNLNKTPKTVVLYAGRESYGTAIIYRGNIVSASPSQPPDIAVRLKCLTGNFLKGSIISRSQPGTVSSDVIYNAVAADLKLTLVNESTNKSVANYTYSGAALKQIEHLNSFGGINAFADDASLIIKNANVPLNNTLTKLDLSSGMIGIPELTELGLKVKMLLDNHVKLGGALEIKSVMYPAANGRYVIYKLSFEIANRDTPFYYVAEAFRVR